MFSAGQLNNLAANPPQPIEDEIEKSAVQTLVWSGPLICAATSPQLDLRSLTYFLKGVLYTSTNLRPPLLCIGPG